MTEIECSEAARRQRKLENTKRYRARYPERIKSQELRRRYGITFEQYNALLVAQEFRCAICKSETPGKNVKWRVDHCHETKRVRGILCHNCNVGLGHFKEDVSLMRRAIGYLVARD